MTKPWGPRSRWLGWGAIGVGLLLVVALWAFRPGLRPSVGTVVAAPPPTSAGSTPARPVTPTTARLPVVTHAPTTRTPSTTRTTVAPVPASPPPPAPVPPGPPKTVTVGDAASGSTVTLRSGDTLEVRLGNCSCGKTWAMYANPSPAVLTYQGERPDPSASNAQLFTFATKAAHTTSLTIGYYGPKDSTPEQTFALTVRVTT